MIGRSRSNSPANGELGLRLQRLCAQDREPGRGFRALLEQARLSHAGLAVDDQSGAEPIARRGTQQYFDPTDLAGSPEEHVARLPRGQISYREKFPEALAP